MENGDVPPLEIFIEQYCGVRETQSLILWSLEYSLLILSAGEEGQHGRGRFSLLFGIKPEEKGGVIKLCVYSHQGGVKAPGISQGISSSTEAQRAAGAALGSPGTAELQPGHRELPLTRRKFIFLQKEPNEIESLMLDRCESRGG